MQNVEVAYNAIDFQDAITMLPLVDSVANDYRNAFKQLRKYEDKEKAGEKVWVSDWNNNLRILKTSWRQLKVFGKLGFPCSEPEILQECEYLLVEEK